MQSFLVSFSLNVLALLKVIRKYIIVSEIYRESTLKQILGRRDMKISAEAHTRLYLAFSRFLINIWYYQSLGRQDITEDLEIVLPADDLKEHADSLKIIFKDNILEALQKIKEGARAVAAFSLRWLKLKRCELEVFSNNNLKCNYFFIRTIYFLK